ncbi:hypothetical protein FF1_043187 [Malus domestica]
MLDGLDAPVGRSGTPADSQSICLGLEHDISFSSYDLLPWKRKTWYNNESKLDRCLKSFPSHEINPDYSRDLKFLVQYTSLDEKMELK